ncbi:MAG TPA: sulfatase-like hydrolase/transferase [Chitinophagaceae bacterium]|nr:sulfatase-like hydrolase/transferase [Chitinophagaceae bacterium]
MIKNIKTFLENWGLHSFLLPIFFVLHHYNQYYGLVSSAVAIKTLLQIYIFFLLFFLLLRLLIRNLNKELLLTTLIGAILLFFGAIKDFLQLTLDLRFISRYVVLLPLILIITIVLVRSILRMNDQKKSNFFLNTLLIIFLLVEGSMLINFNQSFFLPKNLLTKSFPVNTDSLPDSPTKPDVYYLVFDSYPGTLFLKKYMDYDNSSFNEELEKRGFHVIKDPKSNYNRTAFSLASTLNFEYLKDIVNNTKISPKYYNRAKLTIKYSAVTDIFRHYNYKFFNLSVFDFDKAPSIRRENFLLMPEKNVLLYNTLPERLKNDLFWNLLVGKYAVPALQKFFARNTSEFEFAETGRRNFNNTVIDSVMKISSQNNAAPKFIYAHLYLPHPPFFYDENGKENDFKYVIGEESQKNKELFISYLKYTNKIILGITDKIINNHGNNSVVILQSDHGFRDYEGGPSFPETFFKNYSAFYFPDRNYAAFYDTLSNVNTFPILFNKYFNTRFALQKDTTVFLPY